MLGRAEARGDARRGSRRARRSRDRRRASWRAARARCARSASSRTPTPRTATPRPLAPRDPAINTGVGRAVPRDSTSNAEALKSFQTALEADPRYVAGAARRRRARSPTTIRRRPIALAQQGARDQPVRRRARTSSSPDQAADAGKRDEARELLAEGARDQPVEPRGALAARRARLRRGQARRSSRREVAKVLAIAPNYGEVYRVAGELAAHNYRFDEAVDAGAPRARSSTRDNRAGARRSRHASAAHRRRAGGARRRSKRRSSSIPFNVVTYNLLQMMDTLDKFVTDRGRRHRPADAQGRGAGAAGVRAAARAAGARHAVEALRVHAARARSSSRSSRSTTTSPSATSACPA